MVSRGPARLRPGQRDNEYQRLRRLLLEGGDYNKDGCLSEDEARALYDEIRGGIGGTLFAYRLDKWLEGRDYLRSNPRRRLEIARKVIETFGGGNGLSFKQFKKFLYWLGLMCS